MSSNNIKRVERVLSIKNAMYLREEEEKEKKRHDRTNGNLDYMRQQKKQQEKSKREQKQGSSESDNKEKTRRIDVNNASVHDIKAQMEARNAGKIEKLRIRMQENTTGAIRAVKEGRDREKAIEEYEKNFEIEDDDAR